MTAKTVAQPNPWRELWERWFNQGIQPWHYDVEQGAEFCIACGNNRKYGHENSCILAIATALLEQSSESGSDKESE